jgi:hypothetical protein
MLALQRRIEHRTAGRDSGTARSHIPMMASPRGCQAPEKARLEPFPAKAGDAAALAGGAPPSISGQHGPSNGADMTFAPTRGLCNVDAPSSVNGFGPQYWDSAFATS